MISRFLHFTPHAIMLTTLPFIYLVTECTTTSTPKSSDLCNGENKASNKLLPYHFSFTNIWVHSRFWVGPVLGRARVAHRFSLLCYAFNIFISFVLFVFVLCSLSCVSMLTVFLDCSLFITSSIFFNVYLIV